MHLQKIGLLFLALLAANVSTSLPLNFLALFATAHAIAQEAVPKAIAQSTPKKAIAQTPNEEKLDQNLAAKPAVSGSFVDYFAQEAQIKGHQGSVNSASFSPDGKLIVTASTASNEVRVWDISGKLLTEIKGHQGSVNRASFSPDGQRIIASYDGTARVWDTSGKLLTEIRVVPPAV